MPDAPVSGHHQAHRAERALDVFLPGVPEMTMAIAQARFDPRDWVPEQAGSDRESLPGRVESRAGFPDSMPDAGVVCNPHKNFNPARVIAATSCANADGAPRFAQPHGTSWDTCGQ